MEITVVARTAFGDEEIEELASSSYESVDLLGFFLYYEDIGPKGSKSTGS